MNIISLFIIIIVIIDKESSSDDEYVNNDEDEEEYDDDDNESIGDIEPKTRRSSAAKRKSIAILSKDKTESWGNYRNTIDNGPVPRKNFLKIIFKYLNLFMLNRTCINIK